jgi:hypothetical protein
MSFQRRRSWMSLIRTAPTDAPVRRSAMSQAQPFPLGKSFDTQAAIVLPEL